jgi:3-hydroxybutyryl-CoA dehydrogenase/5-formyl-3-hydroxy-2-methylpyridine 4-carboxylate dehydrogenase
MPKSESQIVAVVGAGTMGPGIAATIASHGFKVRLYDIQPESLERSRNTVDTIYETLLASGFLTQDQVAQGNEGLEFTLDLKEALEGVDFVIETIPEDMDVKQSFFRQAEQMVPEKTILASNTSGIPITKLAEACRHPGRVIGMHWSNPPHIIPVIEVIRGAKTEDATVAAIRELTERVQMIPVDVLRDVPGFVENRILYAIMREALHLLDQEVASAEDIDAIVKWGIGYKLSVIGPLELLDMAGLDIYHSVASYLNADLNASSEVSAIVRDKVAKGELGIKTGKGLFEYRSDEIPALMQRRMRLLLNAKRALTESE